MGKIKIHTDEFIYALEDHSFNSNYYLDTKTGEIVFLSEFDMPEEEDLRERIDEEKDRYIYIKPIDSRESFQVMERFIEQLPEGKAKRDLTTVLNQPKPFRRFKEKLNDFPETRKNWFLFHNQVLKKMFQEWLEDNDVDAEILPFPEER